MKKFNNIIKVLSVLYCSVGTYGFIMSCINTNVVQKQQMINIIVLWVFVISYLLLSKEEENENNRN